MEVVAAQPAGDIDDFADEVEAGEFAAFEDAGVEVAGGDASGTRARIYAMPFKLQLP